MEIKYIFRYPDDFMKQHLRLVGLPSLLETFHESKFVSTWQSILLENLIAIMRLEKVRFSYDKAQQKIKVNENSRNYYFKAKGRGFTLYRNGLTTRGKFIYKSYCLQNIQWTADDVVVDCGANSGDLFLQLSSIIDPKNYIALEPNSEDFNCLTLNAKSATPLNLALGDKDEESHFYVSIKDASSSLVEPKSWTSKRKVMVRRLDSLLSEMGISKVKLLKVEAEGNEPEVLKGAIGALDKIEFIAIDGGPERGPLELQTFSTCCNLLMSNGFKWSIHFYHGIGRYS